MRTPDQFGAEIVQVAPLVSRWPLVDPTLAANAQFRPGRAGGSPVTLTAALGVNHTVISPYFSLSSAFRGDVLGDTGLHVVPVAGHILDFWAQPADAPCVLEILGYLNLVGTPAGSSELFHALPMYQISFVTGLRLPFEIFRLLIGNADPDIDTTVDFGACFRSS